MAKIETADFDGNAALEADVRSLLADIERLEVNLNKLSQRFRPARLVTECIFSVGSDNKKVAHNSFYFTVKNTSKEKAEDTLGVSLTGSDIPQDTWGVWALDIGGAGNITVTAAPDNATGYDHRQTGMADMEDPPNNKARMGYVCVYRKTGGVYEPDVTDLNDADIRLRFHEARHGIPTPELTEIETYG